MGSFGQFIMAPKPSTWHIAGDGLGSRGSQANFANLQGRPGVVEGADALRCRLEPRQGYGVSSLGWAGLRWEKSGVVATWASA